MVDVANQDLVTKGRTMSIDQAMEQGIPRSLSVDSVDYTNMINGEMDEVVTEKVRKARKQHKRHQPKLYVIFVLLIEYVEFDVFKWYDL